ncbi:MAG: tRNA (N6-isopentenyl adenosine(37)-C2)-methylthiotransferase MiaB [bacterium]|jgi:tRNA-2-methylthio-N6-dimethylallyladenosine synthase|nr:tRNA (N6-isopentenyl adenosine(37)-C2)-methylthiotransferase MiaB [Bacillota bacterium]HHW55332.1 tRNA (N6-isopentenyl adenosine(37)-C2)-methylthiotransferase MiaB [Bacillota bacterium]
MEICREIGKGKKYHIRTYGCQMNERDSETLAGILADLGYTRTASVEEADLILFNTCCVRETAERKIYGRLNELRPLKKKRPDLLIGVGGCMAQKDKERVLTKAPHVDFVFGTHNIQELPELISKAAALSEPLVQVWEEGQVPLVDLPAQREGKLKAYVTITYGCTNFCTYCIVPYVRGKERSRPPQDIIQEVTELAQEGYKEVTLLGQNVNTYGRDLGKGVSFAQLLREVNQVEGIQRIRYTTSHPRDFTAEIIAAVRDCDKVCEHFHLPIQAGSNRILQRMNRGYTREEYLQLVERIREEVPDCSITTDIIVGFPGEEEEDFAATLDIVRQVRFDNAFTFVFSPRSGTPAAKMKEQVPEDVKKERLNRLMELQDRISRDINEELRGKELEVLVEGTSKKEEKILTSRTRTNKLVLFPGEEDLMGELVTVRITRPQTWNLYGELVKIE